MRRNHRRKTKPGSTSKNVHDGCFMAAKPGRVIQLDYYSSTFMSETVPTSGHARRDTGASREQQTEDTA